MRARDRVRACAMAYNNRTFAVIYHFFAIFLFIHILCCDILLLRLFFVLFVNVSDFFAYFQKFFDKKLA